MRNKRQTEQKQWSNRIVSYDEVDPAMLVANPLNFRTHPHEQEEALAGILREVGMVQDVIVNRNTGLIVDGHLRVKLALQQAQSKLPVKYVDLTPEEEQKILLFLDRIGAMGEIDEALLEELLTETVGFLEDPTLKELALAVEQELADSRSPTGPFKPRMTAVAELRPHARNYRVHPDDEVEHLARSIQQHGLYRNVVVARDGTILAGHGVVQAAKKLGLERVPVVRLNLDAEDPRAIKLLIADNEISHLSESDDRLLSEMLKAVKEQDEEGLEGTGWDERMVANLLMVTRPASEIRDFNAAAEWIGLPEYEPGEEYLKLVVTFRSAADRADFAERLGIRLTERMKSTWWPPQENMDLASVRFDG